MPERCHRTPIRVGFANSPKPEKGATVLLAILLMVFDLSGQSRPPLPSKGSATAHHVALPILDDKRQRGSDILKTQSLLAKSLPPEAQAFALWQIATGYMRFDRAKAIQALRGAFKATTQFTDDDDNSKYWLQDQVFTELMSVDPSYCEAAVSRLSGAARSSAIGALAVYYAEKKQFSRAVAQLTQLGGGEFPYASGIKLIQSLPPDMDEQRQTLFSLALTSYVQHDHKEISDLVGVDDLAEMILRSWKRLPPGLIMQAIDEILEQAKAADGTLHVSVGANEGAASFTSFYDYRLFELLPVLRELDSDKANRLLRESHDVQESLSRFPRGFQSLDADLNVNVTFRDASLNGESLANDRYGMELSARAEQIMEQAEKDPKQALQAALTLADPHGGIRALALQGIARAALKKNPSVAKNATEELANNTAKLPLLDQARFLAAAVDLYFKLGYPDSARKIIDRGFETANRFYREDTDSQEPNTTWKAYWPSTAVWRVFTTLLARISVEGALESIRGIPDQEIQVLESVSLANDLLGVPPRSNIVRFRNGSTNYLQIPSS